MKTNKSKRPDRALTFTEVLVVLATLVVLIMIMLPTGGNRHGSSQTYCLFNLSNLGVALREFAADNNDHYPMSLSSLNDHSTMAPAERLIFSFQAMPNLIASPRVLVCPADTRHHASNFNVLKAANISYFLSLDAQPEMTNTIMLGDRNMEASGQPVKTGLFTLTSDMTLSWTPQMHSRTFGKPCGNLLLGDGSVSDSREILAEVIKHQDISTNRLIVP